MIQNTRIALAPYQAEYQFLTSNDAFTVFGMIHRDQIHFRFFCKKLLVGRDGIYTLFESYSENPKPFWWSPSGFLLWRKILFWIIHVRSAAFFRSIDPRNTGSIVPLIHFWILRSSLAFGIQEIILLWKSDFGDSAAGPILPKLNGFFKYHDGPALLSYLVAALAVILNRLPRVSRPWFCVPWCVYNIPYKKPGVYWQGEYTYDALFV